MHSSVFMYSNMQKQKYEFFGSFISRLKVIAFNVQPPSHFVVLLHNVKGMD